MMPDRYEISSFGGIVPKVGEDPRTELRNGKNETAGRGEAKISASILRRLTGTTWMSAT